MVSDGWELEGGGGHRTRLVQPYSFASLFPGLIYLCIRETIELHPGLSWCIFSWMLNSFGVVFLGRVMPWCVVTHRLHGSVHGGQHSHVERSAWRVGRGDSVSGWCFESKQNWWSFLLTKVLTFSSVILLAFSPVVSFHREFSLSPVKETLISFCPKPGIGLPLRMANEHASRNCFSKLGPYNLPPPMCFATETKPRVNRGEGKIALH